MFAAVVLACSPAPLAAQQVAGSVEAGLESLGQKLLGGVGPERRPALSVMPFPSADQSCPVLSVYVVDELTTALISSVRPRPRVVERQQLEMIIAQNRLDEFLTDPEQRRRLGGLSGIDTLVVGSFAVIGDRLRINARLVAIDSGETISAQAISVPRTGEITELLRQSSGRGRNCLVDAALIARSPAPPPSTAGAGSVSNPPPIGMPCDDTEGVRVCVQRLRRSERDVRVELAIENSGDAAVGIAAVAPKPALTDSDGRTVAVRDMTGLPICGPTLDGVLMQQHNQDSCLQQDFILKRRAFLSIAPRNKTVATLRFRSDAPLASGAFTLTAALGVLPKPPGTLRPAESEQLAARLFKVELLGVQPTDGQP